MEIIEIILFTTFAVGALCVASFLAGEMRTEKHYGKYLKEYETPHEIIMLVLFSFFWFSALLFPVREHRSEIITKGILSYEKGELVKDITYKYEQKGNDTFVKDSTIKFIPNK